MLIYSQYLIIVEFFYSRISSASMHIICVNIVFGIRLIGALHLIGQIALQSVDCISVSTHVLTCYSFVVPMIACKMYNYHKKLKNLSDWPIFGWLNGSAYLYVHIYIYLYWWTHFYQSISFFRHGKVACIN